MSFGRDENYQQFTNDFISLRTQKHTHTDHL